MGGCGNRRVIVVVAWFNFVGVVVAPVVGLILGASSLLRLHFRSFLFSCFLLASTSARSVTKITHADRSLL